MQLQSAKAIFGEGVFVLFIGKRAGLFLALPLATSLCAQQAVHSSVDVLKPTTAAEAPNRDTSYIDEQGTAHVMRVVPVPQNLVRRRSFGWTGPLRISAEAILTAEVAAKLKRLGLPMPAALGSLAVPATLTLDGQGIRWRCTHCRDCHLDPPKRGSWIPYYTGSTDLKDPVLSPIYGDLHGLPPTLFVTSQRDTLLSGTVNLHRTYLLAGVDARLIV
jgi:hypothetical protein